jgi:hypothetical protein
LPADIGRMQAPLASLAPSTVRRAVGASPWRVQGAASRRPAHESHARPSRARA